MKYLVIVFLLLSQVTCSQDKAPTVKDFLGTWEAFVEGDPPNKAVHEEASKVVIYQDASNRIVVLLALRYADRQIRFHYGVAKLDKGQLRFTDQNGFANRVSFGVDSEHGRYLTVAPDFPGAESDYGGFLRVDIN